MAVEEVTAGVRDEVSKVDHLGMTAILPSISGLLQCFMPAAAHVPRWVSAFD